MPAATNPDSIHLRDSAYSGSAALRRAALARIAGVEFTIAAAASVAAALTGDHPFRWAMVAGSALLFRTVALTFAQSAATEAAAQITSTVAAGQLPGVAIVPDGPGSAALRALELPRRIGDYHARTTPARWACGPSAALILLVIAYAHWPVALLLAAATAILPIDMPAVGYTAGHAAERDEMRWAGAVLGIVVTVATASTAIYCGSTLLGYVHIEAAPPLSVGEALFALMLAPLYFAPFRDLASGCRLRDRALAAVRMLDVVRPVPDIVGVRTGTEASERVSRAAVAVTGRDVTVWYPGSVVPILGPIDFDIPPGARCVLTGPPGAGKTTLLRMLAGLSLPSTGMVRVADVAPIPDACAWVGRRPVVLAGSLAANVRLADPGASDERVRNALCTAGFGEILARSPEGIDLPVGDAGLGLSAGAAQRLAVARALIREAPLWLLDEPTAHLDEAAEAELLPILAAACAGRTVVIETRSPALAALADRRWELVDGMLITDDAVLPR